MDGQTLTRVVILADALLMILYDVWAYWKLGQASTISMVLFRDCQKYPIIAVLFGVLVGHLFFPLLFNSPPGD